MPARPLNFLWISFEDTSPTFGCYGDPVAQTPNVDRLAAEGVRYNHCYATAPVCSPARSAVITGCYPTVLGTHPMRTFATGTEHQPKDFEPYYAVPPPYVRCFTEFLRARGYYCTNNGKCDYQFDEFAKGPFTAFDRYGQEDIATLNWRSRPAAAPFLSIFNLGGTHESTMWPDKTPQVTTDADAVSLPPYLPDTPDTRLAFARHYDRLAENDRTVGRLLQMLDEDGLTDSTAVFIWSDHGNGLPRGKRWPYAAGVHVPLVVRMPGGDAGQVSDRLVSSMDLGPTVLSLAGIPRPRWMQGRAFLGRHDESARTHAFSVRDRMDTAYDMVRAVTDGRYHYIVNDYPLTERSPWIPYRNTHPIMQTIWAQAARGEAAGSAGALAESARPPEELYDTRADPHELTNLVDAPEHRDALEMLRDVMEDWRLRYDHFRHVGEAETRRRWCPDGKRQVTAAPAFALLGPTCPGTKTAPPEQTVQGPVLLQLVPNTQGSAMGWTRDPAGPWHHYHGPIPLPTGRNRVYAKAVRYGYKESPVASIGVDVRAG